MKHAFTFKDSYRDTWTVTYWDADMPQDVFMTVAFEIMKDGVTIYAGCTIATSIERAPRAILRDWLATVTCVVCDGLEEFIRKNQ